MKNKPNYNKAKEIAYEALAQHNINNFPIDLLSILDSYEDIRIISYSEMAKKRGCTLEEIILYNSSEDGVIHYSGKRNKYIIAYNDTVNYRERIYWTLAHEFGHYLLGHHKESPESSLARNELRVKEIEKFEREANFFARFFLSPPPLIVEAKIDNTQKLMEFFGVSFTSANHTLKYIQDSYKKGFRFKIPSKIENILLPYAKKIIYGKTCVVCNTFFYFKKSSYCPMCGSNELHNFFRGDDFDMFYPGIEVDENSKALSCPVCSNVETLHGDYCNQCGAFLVNVCAGKVVDTDFGDQIISCRISLPGNSRHCHKCGAESSFLQNGFLKKWHKVKKEHQEQERIEAEYEIAIRK